MPCRNITHGIHEDINLQACGRYQTNPLVTLNKTDPFLWQMTQKQRLTATTTILNNDRSDNRAATGRQIRACCSRGSCYTDKILKTENCNPRIIHSVSQGERKHERWWLLSSCPHLITRPGLLLTNKETNSVWTWNRKGGQVDNHSKLSISKTHEIPTLQVSKNLRSKQYWNLRGKNNLQCSCFLSNEDLRLLMMWGLAVPVTVFALYQPFCSDCCFRW